MGKQHQTTDYGIKVADLDHWLKVVDEENDKVGPSLLEDQIARERIHRFDHERIPERVVHALGAGAHGQFKLFESLEDVTTAGVLTDTSRTTPTFVRFSTVQGSRGSADTVRDVRGFATKFYTKEGNWDIVGNDIPVFFIQESIKFPDLVHAVKPEPDNEVPQGQTAHNSFWDFTYLHKEATHMFLWAMSVRGTPRSYRMMQGFGRSHRQWRLSEVEVRCPAHRRERRAQLRLRHPRLHQGLARGSSSHPLRWRDGAQPQC